MAVNMKVKKGDEVIVITGKHKGKKGKVIKSLPKDRKVVVEGVNVVKKHSKASAASAGGIIEFEKPINVSNVAVVDPKSGEATKVGYKVLKDGKKVRFAKKSGEVIDN